MKKHLIYLFLFSIVRVFAQSGTVIITPGSSGPVSNLDPTIQYAYTATTITPPSGYTTGPRLWQPTGDDTPTTGSSSYTFATAFIS